MEDIQELREQLRKIPTIDLGGCIYAALAIASKLRYSRIYYCYKITNSIIREKYENNKAKKSAHSCSHAVVKHGNMFIDVDNIVTREELEKKYDVLLPVSKEWALKSLENVKEWNPSFRRNRWLPEIERIANITFD